MVGVGGRARVRIEAAHAGRVRDPGRAVGREVELFGIDQVEAARGPGAQVEQHPARIRVAMLYAAAHRKQPDAAVARDAQMLDAAVGNRIEEHAEGRVGAVMERCVESKLLAAFLQNEAVGDEQIADLQDFSLPPRCAAGVLDPDDVGAQQTGGVSLTTAQGTLRNIVRGVLVAVPLGRGIADPIAWFLPGHG